MVVVCVLAVNHITLVAIAALDPAGVLGNGQPDARMTKCPFATIAGDFPSGNDLGFRGFDGHVHNPWGAFLLRAHITENLMQGKGGTRVRRLPKGPSTDYRIGPRAPAQAPIGRPRDFSACNHAKP